MKFQIYSFMVLTLMATTIQAISNTTAEEECRKIHPNIIEKSGAKFLNNGCRVECNVNGIIFSDDIREGQVCMNDRRDYHCVQGCCSSNTGRFLIEVFSASLVDPAYAFAIAFIKNDSKPVTLPVPIKERSKEIIGTYWCKEPTILPIWNARMEFGALFVQDSLVTFEVYDHTGSDKFLGGLSITTNQLITQNLNHEVLHLALLGGPKPGQLNVRITWNPHT